MTRDPICLKSLSSTQAKIYINLLSATEGYHVTASLLSQKHNQQPHRLLRQWGLSYGGLNRSQSSRWFSKVVNKFSRVTGANSLAHVEKMSTGTRGMVLLS